MMWQVLVVAALIAVVAQGREFKVVSTEYGDLEGESFQLHTGARVSRWHGIPFAASLTPENRFLPPTKPAKWQGVRKAHRLPPSCPQWPAGLIWITQPLWGNYKEDCLYLNIYAPEDLSKGPYPVMFYIHGGGYICSGNVQYPGHFLAGHDVVVVVINYRIGALGFMSTGDDEVPGNMGLLDQTAALEYVRDNIANFGGDPNRVTLFGQSAGAASSSLHMFMPQSRGLFHQIIAQSGSEQAVWALNGPGQKPETYTQVVAQQFNCPTAPSKDMMACLRMLTADQLKDTKFDCTPGYFCQGFAPVVDGTTIPDTPINMRRKGDFQKNKVMAGHCKDDGSLYTMILIPESMEGGFNRSEFMFYLKVDMMQNVCSLPASLYGYSNPINQAWMHLLKDRLLDMFLPLAPEKTEDVIKAMDFYYSDWPALDDRDRNREVFNKLITDFGFGTGSDVQIKHHSKYNDVYYYVLGYRTTKADMYMPPWMGVPHNGELPYVIGWPWLQLNQEVRMDSAIPIDFIQWDQEDIEWATYMLQLWTNFAKHGDPTPVPVQAPNGNADTTWSKYNTETFEYQYLDRKIERRHEYRQRNFAFWHSYFPYLSDYKIFPAGEPLILPQEAIDGWKTWKRSTSNTTEAHTKGFDTGRFQEGLHKWYQNLATKAMQNNADFFE